MKVIKLAEVKFKNYLISNNKNMLSLERIYEFLRRSYWASQRDKETIAKSIENSECFGIYFNDDQTGFARIVTDYSVMYWLCKEGLAGRQLVVRAGGCREPIDPIRFIGNRSSGKMGFALSDATLERGARRIMEELVKL